MPILNPQQAYNIWNSCKSVNNQLISFLLKYLPIASENIYLNRKFNEVHNNLKIFLVENITLLLKAFDLNQDDISENNLGTIDNVYTFLYKTLQQKRDDVNMNDILSIKLDFAGYLNQKIDKIPTLKSFFLIPFKSIIYGWYISDKHMAVLSYQKNKSITEIDKFLIHITASILIGSGYMLILCLFDFDDNDYFTEYMKDFDISLFSETHIFSEKKSIDYPKMTSLLNNKFGHIYIYIHYNKYISDNIIQKTQQTQNRFVHIYTFSKELSNIFSAPNSLERVSISFNTFEQISKQNKGLIIINLCNVALYETDDKINDLTPVEISGISYGLISSNDFLFSKFKRIMVTISNKNFYVEFPELHLMNPELYISEPMYLSKQNLDIEIVEKVATEYERKTNRRQRRNSMSQNLNENTEEKLLTAFHYIHKHSKDLKGDKIKPYSSQIYAVYQAISLMNDVKNKGCILQVHTGEGKSIIIQALAGLLSRHGNNNCNVHIATSNIILAARDFENSYDYYQKCADSYGINKRPAILLHQNERKFIDKFLQEKVKLTEKEEFYDDKNFENPSNMNISVLDNTSKCKSNIIYSTFFNFEAYYLSKFSRNSTYTADYFNNTYLIIDEADTILIDELTNGTILSKPMNSNASEVLEFIYYEYNHGNKNVDSILSMVKDKYPECEDINEDDIQQIFKDIEKVTSDDFRINKSYIIEKDEKGNQIIVPFDSEHKGIAEPNKEFSGYIQQLIGIKEKTNNPNEFGNLIIQPLSMNYLFISHPIYVNKYKGVCGFTATIGTEKDIKTYEKQYKLVTQKVPRNKMNLRKDLPIILCNDINERNERICSEIIYLNKKEYPVLAVFNDISEINEIKRMLINNYQIEENKISVFTGKNLNNTTSESDKEKLEKESGNLSSITLGTNFCGRGVSINYSSKPIHVIVSYFNDDERSINQVLGRSGRNGNPGLTRIICTKKMFYKKSRSVNNEIVEKILDEYTIKNDTQNKFINEILKNYQWIFNETPLDILPYDKVQQLRNFEMNINRITACKCIFPICMSVESFLDIQAQRIYSLKNCPNCKQTWNLFRFYMRELILESWSLFVNSVDINYKKMINNNRKFNGGSFENVENEDLYNTFFQVQYAEYMHKLGKYCPISERKNAVDLFLWIHKAVGEKWNSKIISNIGDGILAKKFETQNKQSSIIFRIGFFPISLDKNLGARITTLTNNENKKNEKSQLYCMDPELKYINKTTHKPFSITRIIDNLFDAFHELVDEKLKGFFGLSFFLRRTLAGCEFGICVDPSIKRNEYLINCLSDQDPILLFTICSKSTVFWIGGILMMILIFLSSLFTIISKFLFPAFEKAKIIYQKGKDIFKKLLFGDDEDEGTGLIINSINNAFDLIINYLNDLIDKNQSKTDSDFSIIANIIRQIFIPASGNIELPDGFFTNMKISNLTEKLIKTSAPIGKSISIAMLLIILLAQFILNFKNKKSIKFNKKTTDWASDYKKDHEKNPTENITSYRSYSSIQNQIEQEINATLNQNEK